MQTKLKALQTYFKDLGAVAVAFSGGVDSTFLLKVAHDVLGDRCIAVTVRACAFPGRELQESMDFCAAQGIVQKLVDANLLSIDGFARNPPNRCYLCKTALFTQMRKVAAESGITAIAEGSNTDDDGDYRPGHRAVAEQGILSPLRAVGLSKTEIRALSKERGLPTWEKPSFACLASRFVYGETITEEKLCMVEQAEKLLFDLGFTQVRVRIHGNMARIELARGDFEKLLAVSDSVYAAIKDLGFTYVALDLGGYRTGSMNETLEK